MKLHGYLADTNLSNKALKYSITYDYMYTSKSAGNITAK
jgi:hypothetical protein